MYLCTFVTPVCIHYTCTTNFKKCKQLLRHILLTILVKVIWHKATSPQHTERSVPCAPPKNSGFLVTPESALKQHVESGSIHPFLQGSLVPKTHRQSDVCRNTQRSHLWCMQYGLTITKGTEHEIRNLELTLDKKNSRHAPTHKTGQFNMMTWTETPIFQNIKYLKLTDRHNGASKNARCLRNEACSRAFSLAQTNHKYQKYNTLSNIFGYKRCFLIVTFNKVFSLCILYTYIYMCTSKWYMVQLLVCKPGSIHSRHILMEDIPGTSKVHINAVTKA